MIDTCIQVNLQRGFGGGEVYTAAFARALSRAGVRTRLFVHPAARAWGQLDLGDARLEPIADVASLPRRLAGEPPRWLAFHTLARPEVVDALRSAGHRPCAFAHMPLYGRDPRPLKPFDLVIGVSRHVIASLHEAGIRRVYAEPLYGIADLRGSAGGGPLVERSRFDWDRRKFRDRALSWVEPAWRALLPPRRYQRRPGLTLGVVSRITPIKQFPLLFSKLAPVLARHPGINLEIFGSGGYASVRDLRRALAPLGGRARWWGHQPHVAAVYRQIDALVAGLPEKEALGLNVIEAQACGTPVLAPDAPPFDETVLHGVTGLRYRDPREDDGKDFERALGELAAGFRIDPARAAAHLAQFSEEAFAERAGRLGRAVGEALAARAGGAA